MNRTLAGLIVLLSAGACSETGPDAPPRANGCIDVGCGDTPVAPSPGGPNGTTPDAGPIVYGDPLEGTSKAATLVKGGFRFTEGPVWLGDRLLFTDTRTSTIHEFVNGAVTPFRTNTEAANGLAVDRDGNLVICHGGGKRVGRSGPKKTDSSSPIAAEFADKAVNAPNDVIVRADKNVYFTDPNYSGQPGTQDDEAVYRIAPDGAVSRVDHDFAKPNGIAIAPDQDTLYVVDNGAGKLLAAQLEADGKPSDFGELASVPGGDGMAVDDAGNLYVAGDGGIQVLDRTGKKLGTVTVAVKPTNCTFGGADRRTLYITANGPENDAKTGLYQIVLKVPGLP